MTNKQPSGLVSLIGGTPLVPLTRIFADHPSEHFGKVEYFNPGGSAKDRIARQMIEAAEAEGILTPDTVVIDGTSGNTGAGLALVAAVRGYRTILVVSDKVSEEKVRVLRAYGAEIVRTLATVDLDHPLSVRNTVERLREEIPNSWSSAQYDNPANPQAHFETTGPEIWEQTEGRITHFVANVGTGGTISGVGRYLKEVSDGKVVVIGADPIGSAYSGPVDKYLVEGAGRAFANEELWPQTYDREIVDRFVQVSDAASFSTARRLARTEGLLVGPSAGTVAAASLQLAESELGSDAVVVSFLIDSGRGYLSKLYDNDWLTANGLPTIEEDGLAPVTDLRGQLV